LRGTLAEGGPWTYVTPMPRAQVSPNVRRLVVLLALSLAGCLARAEKPAARPAPREVEVLTLSASEVRDTGEYLASIISRQNVSIVSQVSGYVRRIAVRPGQAVKVGDTLVELDSRQEAAALESADAQQRAAVTAAELAARTAERTRSLHKEGLVTGQELDRAEADARAAEAQGRAAAARVAEQRVGVGFHVVRAPFAGTVGDVIARVGDFVSAATPLTSITQGATLELSVRLPPERARKVRPGTPVEVLDPAGKAILTTTIYFVAPEADARTQLVDVSAMFENTVGLRPSEMVRARIVYGKSQALVVPVLSIVRQSGQAFVYAVEQRGGGLVVARRPVTLGALTDQSYVVEKGLSPGDRIAVSSLQALRDGAPIVPKASVADAGAR
jgi:RND family efflux transporter MFP subunit